jgi:hypothetical protein
MPRTRTPKASHVKANVVAGRSGDAGPCTRLPSALLVGAAAQVHIGVLGRGAGIFSSISHCGSAWPRSHPDTASRTALSLPPSGRLLLAQRLVHLAGHPEPVQEHGQPAGYGHDSTVSGIAGAGRSVAQAPTVFYDLPPPGPGWRSCCGHLPRPALRSALWCCPRARRF